MLVLSRKVGEQIKIGENITITVNRLTASRVTIGIHAPDDVVIKRGELAAEERRDEAGQQAAEHTDVL